MAWWPAPGLMACGQQLDLELSREMPMLSAAAAGAGCDAGPVRERSAECWLGLVAQLRGDLGDAGVAGSQQPLCVLHPPVGQVLHGRPADEPGEPRRERRSGPSRPRGQSRQGPRRPGVLVDQSERRAELRAGKRAEPAATWRQVGYVRLSIRPDSRDLVTESRRAECWTSAQCRLYASRLLSAERAVAPRKVNMSLRRVDAWPSRLEAGSRHGWSSC
jgi:hypothetical protein